MARSVRVLFFLLKIEEGREMVKKGANSTGVALFFCVFCGDDKSHLVRSSFTTKMK